MQKVRIYPVRRRILQGSNRALSTYRATSALVTAVLSGGFAATLTPALGAQESLRAETGVAVALPRLSPLAAGSVSLAAPTARASVAGPHARNGEPASNRAIIAGRRAGSQRAAPDDSVTLTLEEALNRALGRSEEIRLARASVEVAGTQVTSARAQALPQLNGTAAYTRTYYSPFQSGPITIPDSMKFSPDSMAPILERLSYIENNAEKAALAGMGGLFSSLPLGRPNTYVTSVSASQILYSGGRTGAALRIAADFKRAAQNDFTEQASEIAMQVRTAYVQAELAQQLEGIAQAALDQAEAFRDQQQLRLDAGSSSELDVLRAQVSAENLRPQLVAARNAAEVAMLNLKRLVDLPLTQPLQLTTELDTPEMLSVDTAAEPSPERVAERRAAVAGLERQVAIREQQVSLARGAYLPTVALSANFGAQNMPSTVFGFDNSSWRKDVSASIAVQLPLFTGFKRSADLEQAQIELGRARLQLEQLKEGVQVQYQQARGERERALSTIAARRTTVDQAQRVHDLTVLRFDRGLATQLEVSDARLALLQARTNLAQAVADFHIADAGVQRSLGSVPSGLPAEWR